MVHFVGAGPGAPDLITLRGKALLEQADVIIYAGSLVNKQLLDYAKEGAEIHNSANMTLEEVIDVMVKANSENKDVVRLHTGDQSIYGAVREQMDILRTHNIEFNSTPGVSSFQAAAASINAEFTLPSVSQTVILTRMEGRTPVPEKEDIRLLASHQASMAIFLTTTMLDELSKRLIEGGYSPDTPAAIIYKASWEDEKRVITTVKNLQAEAEKHNITKMAQILVGHFLGDEYERSKLYDPAFTHEFREASK